MRRSRLAELLQSAAVSLRGTDAPDDFVSYEELMIRALVLCTELYELRKRLNSALVQGEDPQKFKDQWDKIRKELSDLTTTK